MVTFSWLHFLGTSAFGEALSSAKHITANEILKGYLSWQELQPTSVWKPHSTHFQIISPVYYFAFVQKLERCYFCGFPTHPNTPKAFFRNLSCEHLFPFALCSEYGNIELQLCCCSVIPKQLEWGSSSAMYISCQDQDKQTQEWKCTEPIQEFRSSTQAYTEKEEVILSLAPSLRCTWASHLHDGNAATTDATHSVLPLTEADHGFSQTRLYQIT